MTPTVEAQPQQPETSTDLVEAIRQVLAASDEPLTPNKIKAALAAPFRSATVEELVDCLNRQVASQVFTQFPRYRSAHDRYWDRPMPVHVAALLQQVLEEAPLPLFEIRRKLPAYAVPQAETVIQEQLRLGRLHLHPPLGKRGRERIGAASPDSKAYLRPELENMFRKLRELGFTQEQLRNGATELLHEEEWAEPVAPPPERETSGENWIAHAPETSSPRPHATQPAAETPAALGPVEKLDNRP